MTMQLPSYRFYCIFGARLLNKHETFVASHSSTAAILRSLMLMLLPRSTDQRDHDIHHVSLCWACDNMAVCVLKKMIRIIVRR